MVGSLIHLSGFQRQKNPEITDVVVLYSMFYLEHQGVFISGYSQMKSNASVNDDRAAVNPGRSLKGFLKWVWQILIRRGAMDYKLLDKPGQRPAVSPDNTSRLLRIPEIISHSVFPVSPWKPAGSTCPQQCVQQQRTNITPQQLHLKWFGLYRAAPMNEENISGS